MSFDKDTRHLLARTITACRRRLTEDVTDQLTGVFGLHPDGTLLALNEMSHLSPDQAASAGRLRDLLDHYTAGAVGGEKDRRKSAYERMTLEISFTILNRLAALRLCEERGLVVECVRRGTASDGFRLFERVSGGALGGRYDTYRVFLECLFDELALDLGVLFDRTTPQSSVFPSERCMEDVLGELNKPELTHLWTEDETIGWIYQYFNPPEERKAMRDASQAPRNSRELAVRNQFFTPRYVVEFLTDNTLGRIWYEMQKGDTAIKDECRYLVMRPYEVFLAAGEKAPPEAEGRTDLSQDELLKQPVYIEHRIKKDPRDLSILDPACGSGHFLIYAFDLLERIYEESWGAPESPKFAATGQTIQEDFETLEDLRREVPKLIMEHNLHGIDIDPRAVQIAALALWLRAQKTWKNLGIKAAKRPRVAKSNIVTAEPMPGEEDMKEEFTAGLKPRVLGQLVDTVFDKMKLAGEAGSLLKIEEEIKDVVSEAKAQWLRGPSPEQQFLFPGMGDQKAKQQELQFDFKGITDEGFWAQAENLIIDALKKYSEETENGHTVRRHLFVEDAARGFNFIDLCRKRYDVVLMNPPFGLECPSLTDKLRTEYENAYTDLYSCFVARGQILSKGGLSGAIVSRAFLLIRRHGNFRRFHVLPSISLLLDLGNNVMDDALVESCAVVLNSTKITTHLLAFNWRKFDDEERLSASISAENATIFPIARANSLPFNQIIYSLPQQITDLFESSNIFEPKYGFAKEGGKTFDNFRFLRLFWEVNPKNIGYPDKWVWFAKGGEVSAYRGSIHILLNRFNFGDELDAVNISKNGSTAQVNQASTYWGLPGCTYSRRSKYFAVRILPSNCIFSAMGPAILPNTDRISVNLTLAFFNSLPIRALIHMQSSASDYLTGTIQTLPICEFSNETIKSLETIGNRLFRKKQLIDIYDETDPEFMFHVAPVCLAEIYKSKEMQRIEYVDLREKLESDVNKQISVAYKIDNYDWAQDLIYGIENDTDNDDFSENRDKLQDITKATLSLLLGIIYGRWDIRVLSDSSLKPTLAEPNLPLPTCSPNMLVSPDGLPAKPDNIVSEEWLRTRPDVNTPPPKGTINKAAIPDAEYPLRIPWNGILVDDPGGVDGWLPQGTPQPHPDDIVRRIHEVLDLLWKNRANDVAQEACDIIGVSSIRDYFRKPAKFFQDHLKRYSKSRRKAPIYWPLSTASGSYTIWFYYHRLTDQTLYAAVNKYVEPKISEIERSLARIEDELKGASGGEATRLRDRLNETQAFLGELRDLRGELLRIAALPYKPDLNDGVIINAAPLNSLFSLRSWANDTKKVLDKLTKGDYDWAHLAYTIWPDRVRNVCKKDRSIAIAHGLEELCEVENPASKKKGGRGRRRKEAAR